ncbi:hypothetical protein LP420_30320 [Massilia sp. B-10]|nr:hypothetical protein LP420_30320 [Massilia sp. B-10]
MGGGQDRRPDHRRGADKAREGIQISIKHGITPTKVERERAANELTLGDCFDDYKIYLVKRNP